MSKLEIGIGPMSIEVINAIIKYANVFDTEIMLIASRNQIECEELGGGYVGGLTSESFAKHVRAIDSNGKIKICRDHSGPYLHASEKGLPYEEAMARTLVSLQADIDSGFDLLHIDTSMCPDPYQAAERMFKLATASSKPLEFEFGSEENVGVAASAAKFEHDVKFAKQFVNPKFVVGQSGSLVKSVYQVGTFNEDNVKRMVEVAAKHGTLLKEHNADYITREQVAHRKSLGIGALNVAPEFGVTQTKVVAQLAQQLNITKELNAFRDVVLAGGKWKKWEHGNFIEPLKFLSAGHYHFTSPEYKALVEAVNRQVNVDEMIQDTVWQLLNIYCVS